MFRRRDTAQEWHENPTEKRTQCYEVKGDDEWRICAADPADHSLDGGVTHYRRKGEADTNPVRRARRLRHNENSDKADDHRTPSVNADMFLEEEMREYRYHKS